MDYVTLVEQAVKQFYAEGNNEAHSWLLRAQVGPEAWAFVWQLLEPSKPCEVQFFAASTLHTKISRQWNEVPKADYPVLRERLLNCIKQQNTAKFVLAKLCQAMAGFLVKSTADEGIEKEKNLVDELVEMLPYNSAPSLELLLTVLTALPIELKGKQDSKLVKIGEGLASSWYKITWLLQQIFPMCEPNSETSNEALYLLTLRCAGSWLKNLQLPLEPAGNIYPHLLVAAAHYAPNRDGPESDNVRGWEAVSGCLIIILTHYELCSRRLTLWEWAKSLVMTALLHNRKYFCEVLAAMGETHSRTFLLGLLDEENEDRKRTSEGLIQLMLECSEQEGRYPTEETRSCIPFTFWYGLQDDLQTLDEPFEERAMQALKPIYARLAQALLRKSTLPPSPSEAGDADERELFRCYRQAVADTFHYCYCVLNHELLVLLGQRLSQPLDSAEKWTELESTLHAFEALADSVGTEESKYTPALLDLVLTHIPYDVHPPQVLACTCSIIRAYADWIGQHPGPWLEKVLRVITLGLTRGSITAPHASMALKDLARECGSNLAPFAPSILTMIGQTLPNITPGTGEDLRLMYAVGKLVNTLSSEEEQRQHLDATLGLCIVKIRESLAQPLFMGRAAVTNHLKMVSMFFHTLEGSIGKVVLDVLLPIFNQIVGHPEWSQDNATLEAMHTCAQRSLSSIACPEIAARPLLPILANSYKKWPHPAALGLLRQLVLLFGKDPDNVVAPVFAELSSVTLSGIRACRSVRGDLADWSELLEAYFNLLSQICKKNTRLLLQVTDQIPEMLQCGISCLTLQISTTVKAAGYFLSLAIMQSPHLQTFIQPIGQELVSVILQCVAGEVPRYTLDPHADVLLALNKACPEWSAQWLRTGLEEKISHTSTTQAQRETFLRNVLRERRTRMAELLKEFSLLCRQPAAGL